MLLTTDGILEWVGYLGQVSRVNHNSKPLSLCFLIWKMVTTTLSDVIVVIVMLNY